MNKLFEKYKFGFDFWGLVLFLVMMIPTIVWFAVPAPNDILRTESITPVIDLIGSISQVVFVFILCILIRKNIEKIRISKYIVAIFVFVALYFLGWVLYYLGYTNSLVIILTTLPPCLSFVCYAIDRKNLMALIPIVIFTICHVIFGCVNFIF